MLTLSHGQASLLDDLKTWVQDGPGIAMLEGFPGVGKSEVADALVAWARKQGRPGARIEVPSEGSTPDEDLLLGVAQELHDMVGADPLSGNGPVAPSVGRALRSAPVLVVIDEFQEVLSRTPGRPGKATLSFLKQVEAAGRPGRVLLISNRRVEGERWCEHFVSFQAPTLSVEEAEALLASLLNGRERADDVPLDRRREVVRALGRNPRALQTFVGSLVYDSLDDLIRVVDPDLWADEDRDLSPELLATLERRLLRRLLDRLEPGAVRMLQRLSVHRKPVKKGIFPHVSDAAPDAIPQRNALIERFLLDRRQNRYQPQTIARETARLRLAEDSDALRSAHSAAADYYASRFSGETTQVASRLAADFAEARFHLTRAGRRSDLHDLTVHFGDYIRQQYKEQKPPADPAALDDRIALLSALLEAPGDIHLEMHLARCLAQRNAPSDLEAAVLHARRSTVAGSPYHYWLRRGEIEGAHGGGVAAVEGLKAGIEVVSPQRNLYSLYQAAAEILSRDGNPTEAVALLREGIGRVPPEKNLFALYQAAAEILSRDGNPTEAVALLREGIGRVPPEKNLFALYQAAAEILARDGNPTEAVALLREGIGRVPTSQPLYQAAAEILSRDGNPTEAVALLREGIGRVPPEKSLDSLYQAAAEILARDGNPIEALRLIGDGLARLPHGKGVRANLARLGFLFASANRDAGWIERMLQEGGARRLSDDAKSFGRIIQLQLQDRWDTAADTVVGGLDLRQPRTFDAMQGVFSWLAAGHPARAEALLANFQDRISLKAGEAYAWLAAFVALERGDAEGTRQYAEIFLGHGLPEGVEVTRDQLLRLWDRESEMLGVPTPPFYFPHLPPRLTGLPETVTRLPYGPSVLPASSPLESPLSEGEVATPVDGFDAASSLRILAVATEWASHHGGVSTLNRRLCTALAEAGHDVVCLVPESSPDERDDARQAGVRLVDAEARSGMDEAARLALPSPLPDGFVPDAVVGHDRTTGPAAREQAQTHGSALALVVHTRPGELEWYKSRVAPELIAQRAEDRERLLIQLLLSAELVVPVGPALDAYTRTILRGETNPPEVFRLDPGVRDAEIAREPAPIAECLVLGRAEDEEQKGLGLAARALGQYARDHGANDVRLVIRGAMAGTGADLRQRLIGLSGVPSLKVQPREFSADTDRIQSDLLRASLLLMPSLAEGFGLSALEAIEAGTPVVVSAESGLGLLLGEVLDDARPFVLPIRREPEEDARRWATSIFAILQNQKAAYARAAELRTTLAAQLSWREAGSRLGDALIRVAGRAGAD